MSGWKVGVVALVAMALGAVAVLVAVGLGATTTGSGEAQRERDGGADAVSAGQEPPGSLTLPDAAGGLRPQAEVLGEPSEPLREQALEETAQLLSESRQGAAASVRAYADEHLETMVTVWAVAQESPPLWSPQEAELMAQVLGTVTPMEWVEREGEVECLVRPLTVAFEGRGGGGTEANPEGETAAVEIVLDRCQLVDDGVTLLLTGRDVDVSGAAEVLRDVASGLGRG